MSLGIWKYDLSCCIKWWFQVWVFGSAELCWRHRIIKSWTNTFTALRRLAKTLYLCPRQVYSGPIINRYKNLSRIYLNLAVRKQILIYYALLLIKIYQFDQNMSFCNCLVIYYMIYKATIRYCIHSSSLNKMNYLFSDN